MLKVCGITYDHTLNYGSELQSYALQAAIEKIEIGGEKCKYALIPFGLMIHSKLKKTSDRNPVIILKRFVGESIQKSLKRKFRTFDAQIHEAKCGSLDELSELNLEYDAFVCGSDVIWRSDLSKQLFDRTAYDCSAYYLSFAEKYKFSYAASFGISNPGEKARSFAAPKIADLNAIGVREESAVRIVRQWTGRDAELQADPVLLLSAEEWSAIAEEKGTKGQVFVYTTHDNPVISQLAKKLSHTCGGKVVEAYWRKNPKDILSKRAFNPHMTIQRWIQQLRDAEYVLTNSFHATVFSLIFHKKFFTVVHGDPQGGVNFRMYELLKAVGFEDRIFSEAPEELNLSEPDFSRTDAYIDALREKSLSFLQRNLEAAYKEKIGG